MISQVLRRNVEKKLLRIWMMAILNPDMGIGGKKLKWPLQPNRLRKSLAMAHSQQLMKQHIICLKVENLKLSRSYYHNLLFLSVIWMVIIIFWPKDSYQLEIKNLIRNLKTFMIKRDLRVMLRVLSGKQ